QLNLLVAERPHLSAINGDHTNQIVILQHRHAKYSSEVTEFNRSDHKRMTVAVGLMLPDVSDVHDLLRGRSATNRSVRCHPLLLTRLNICRWRVASSGNCAQVITVAKE